jgi:hypothetical protein
MINVARRTDVHWIAATVVIVDLAAAIGAPTPQSVDRCSSGARQLVTRWSDRETQIAFDTATELRGDKRMNPVLTRSR